MPDDNDNAAAGLALVAPDGRRAHITASPWRIGRHDSCNLVIPHQGVSNHHATLDLNGAGAHLRDENSKNGTFVNGVRLKPGTPARIVSGDRLRFSKSDLDEHTLERTGAAGMDPAAGGDRRLLLIVKTLNGYLDEEEILREYLRAARRLVRADRALVVAPGGGGLEVRAADGSDGVGPPGFSRRVVEQVLRDGGPVVHTNLGADPVLRAARSLGAAGLSSVVCVPLMVRELDTQEGPHLTRPQRDRVLGALYLASAGAAESFSRADAAVLTALTDHAAVSLERARLHAEAIAHERELAAAELERAAAEVKRAAAEHELKLAGAIQQGLLPRDFGGCSFAEVFALNQPAQDAGGDFYDLVPLDADRLAWVIGDVAGHGIAAAVLMATTQACLWTASTQRLAPAEVLASADRLIAGRAPADRFVTACYGQLHRSGLLTYAMAGHPPPFLRRRSGTIETLSGGGPALGWGFAADDATRPYRDAWVRLDPGDTLVLFTDGMFEAMDAHGRQFGLPRLTAVLASLDPRATCQNVAHDLLRQVVEYVPCGRRDDDATLAVIRFVGPVPP